MKNPVSISVAPGNKNDAKIGLDNIQNIVYDISKMKKVMILADKMYDTKEFRKQCKSKKMTPVIDYNVRNTKDVSKIKKLSEKEKQIYRERIKVENTFAIIKKYKRLDKIYDFSENTYLCFVNLAVCLMLSK